MVNAAVSMGELEVIVPSTVRLEVHATNKVGDITVDQSIRGGVDIRLDKVLEVDRKSRAARIQAGVLGPQLEAQLKPHGVTLRHFPQSFEYSTLGGTC